MAHIVPSHAGLKNSMYKPLKECDWYDTKGFGASCASQSKMGPRYKTRPQMVHRLEEDQEEELQHKVTTKQRQVGKKLFLPESASAKHHFSFCLFKNSFLLILSPNIT